MNPGGGRTTEGWQPERSLRNVIDTDQMTLRYLEVPYDIAKTQRAMQMARTTGHALDQAQLRTLATLDKKASVICGDLIQ